MPQNKKVLVAMSGGVDSSVAALLLQENGFDVSGVTFKLYCYGESSGTEIDKSCCGLAGIRDAQSVCRHLGINHTVLDLTQKFEEKVLFNFRDEYINGRTPIPCVECNTHIKFGPLLDLAKKVGANYIATGHYAYKRRRMPGLFPLLMESNEKDQTYFLWGIDRRYLDKILFPVGWLTKNEVREIAARRKLPVAEKKESQDLCFVGNRNLIDVIKDFVPNDSRIIIGGKIMCEGEHIGDHNGTANFTVGQKINDQLLKADRKIKDQRLYVRKIDPINGVIEAAKISEIGSKKFVIGSTNWFFTSNFVQKYLDDEKNGLYCRIRHRGRLIKCFVGIGENNTATIEFDNDSDTISPGQSCVVYSADKSMLGGGVILSSFSV